MQLFNEEACQATDWEASGGVLLEVFLVFYIFWGFYLVTDVFFVPAISVLTNKLHIPDDLAGSTLKHLHHLEQNSLGFGVIRISTQCEFFTRQLLAPQSSDCRACRPGLEKDSVMLMNTEILLTNNYEQVLLSWERPSTRQSFSATSSASLC
jgi:hypothetical protein